MLTREDVIWAYRYLLGRDPESNAVIDSHMHVETREVLRQALLQSPEFLGQADGLRFPDAWVIAPVLGQRRNLWLNLADRHVSLGCLRDQYEPFETDLLTRMIEPGMTFLDLGANIGWFTLLASTLTGETGRIIAFEPRPETHRYLSKTVALNQLEGIVEVHCAGAADVPSEATLQWSKDTDNPGGSHLVFGDVDPQEEGARIRLVAIDALELAALDVVKMDIEGAEYRAMVGAEATLRRHLPLILSELHPAQLRRVSGCSAADYIGFMASLGYACLLADRARPGEGLVDFPTDLGHAVTNVLFVPAQRLDEAQARFFAA